MSNTIEVLEYTLPDYLACYLINGDLDGITEQERNEIDEYLKEQGVYIVDIQGDSSFRWSNHLNNIGANCSTYTAHKMNNTFGVLNANNEHIDVSKSEKGAKQYATRNGYNTVSIRYNSGYDVDIIAIKKGKQWVKYPN